MLEEKIRNLSVRHSSILGHEQCFKSAILLPLVHYQGKLCVLFEKRAKNLKVQPGEICFPGGAVELYDAGKKETAIRETCEELNLKVDDIEYVAPLDIFVSPFNIIVYPFVAYIKDYKKIEASRDEVEYVFYVPLDYLLEHEPLEATPSLRIVMPEDYPYDLIPQGKNYPYREGRFPQQFYRWKDEIIWGLTARILSHFIQLIKNN